MPPQAIFSRGFDVSRRETVGELSVLLKERWRSDTAVCVRDVELIRVSQSAFDYISARYPAVARHFTHTLAHRYRELLGRLGGTVVPPRALIPEAHHLLAGVGGGAPGAAAARAGSSAGGLHAAVLEMLGGGGRSAGGGGASSRQSGGAVALSRLLLPPHAALALGASPRQGSVRGLLAAAAAAAAAAAVALAPRRPSSTRPCSRTLPR